ncbi:conserved hypothetical protein [Talaromyces stipitatus ATCC 10500]|uniref:Altered inheritance of mitochondria protein 21 n=1 Tax=Talaromyces stipitatus (strain ATCC 10500 / CBS 375.48 / QM 6759 / NRRL 1006) TaxID=441959 RepID=B8M4I0_TALSN|nr:uncharacterized protein TSTA_024970 [Talaromyces stipitatus ATCC 10500]EED19175.1 conserved hypothetical protein [Talaromyces stipitatus ATCC 10500]
MSAPSAPVIPPRPARSPRTLGADIPSIPPRPANRRLDRSVSPARDSYAPSPLNEPPQSAGLARTTSHDVPTRPPSVTIPSLGEEGIEYDELSSQQPEPAETRNVGSDLKLHAPKPSLPTSSAKARVQTVTRTDSDQAAAAGFGKSSSPALEDSDQRSRSIYSKPSGSRAESTASSTRRQSMQFEEEHGIPEIGQRVPMLANAGDVQAPSPAPPRSGSASGQRASRHHHRTRSGRDVFLPPGSYGLHGHGVHATDKFEKAWYDKHPDELAREEQGQYGPAIAERSTWALSSDDLNRLVHSSDNIDTSVGTSPAFIGTPAEEVGYIATDELTRQDTQPAVESPLRHSSFAASELTRTRSAMSTASSDAGSRIIHVDEPYHSIHHPDGLAFTPDPTSTHDYDDAIEDDEPILAPDESRPGSAFLHPAISPRRASTDFHDIERVRSRTPSAPNSRPTSLHGAPAGLTRWSSRGEEHDDVHTPLEDVEEYEPLFPDDDKSSKPLSAAERFQKRTELLKHRFPSQDIWEDTPDSLQLHASVSTPELPEEQPKPKFETPEAEEQRKRQAEQIDSHKVASHILQGQPGAQRQTRPDLVKHRFPSRDIWEDAPESQQLVTTIEPSESETTSPDTAKPPAIPSRPSIPPRPAKVSRPADGAADEKKAPSIPDRPKPQIPTRPSKPASAESAAAPPVNRNKPVVPARPVGGKIAGVKANFLSDLNSRLQLGPQAPKPAAEKKEEETPEEKAPLADARKGRARGPARRKPAASSASEKRLPSIPEIRIMDPWNVWELGVDGNLTVGLPEKQPVVEVKPYAPDVDLKAEEKAMAPPIAKNMAGEFADPVVASSENDTEPQAEANNGAHEPPKPTTLAHHEDSRTSEHVSPKQSVDQPSETESTQVKALEPESTTTGDNVSDQVSEQLAATADGKKRSDGSIDNEGATA